MDEKFLFNLVENIRLNFYALFNTIYLMVILGIKLLFEKLALADSNFETNLTSFCHQYFALFNKASFIFLEYQIIQRNISYSF